MVILASNHIKRCLGQSRSLKATTVSLAQLKPKTKHEALSNALLIPSSQNALDKSLTECASRDVCFPNKETLKELYSSTYMNNIARY